MKKINTYSAHFQIISEHQNHAENMSANQNHAENQNPESKEKNQKIGKNL